MSNQLYYWKNIPTDNTQAQPSRESIIDAHETLINKFYDEFFGNRKNFLNSNSSYPKIINIAKKTKKNKKKWKSV